MFDPENLFWRIISRGVDIVGLSLAWAALSLPIITCGAATSALYYTIVKCFRQGERETFHIFWQSFKANLKQGCILSLMAAVLLFVLFYGYSVMQANWSSVLGQVMFVVYDLLMLVPLGMLCYLFPMQSRFIQPTKELIMNSFYIALRHIFTTIVVTLMMIEAAITTIEYWWPIFFVPTLCAWIASLFLERIFAKYLSADQKQKFANKE
ncbi:MAG: YesL family protein [Solobacterium sp.]|jgi:uncharacterized membrane protein YesL|nr:YesL family protein [Solobacterium sp.]MCH4205999.1 YesL family protein [Solobacterium sp.]MCH4227393.1 YesL family protein [Solobacterium sp.]MCH4282762.1 YesL family protein [Solobacterium sp.]